MFHEDTICIKLFNFRKLGNIWGSMIAAPKTDQLHTLTFCIYFLQCTRLNSLCLKYLALSLQLQTQDQIFQSMSAGIITSDSIVSDLSFFNRKGVSGFTSQYIAGQCRIFFGLNIYLCCTHQEIQLQKQRNV